MICGDAAARLPAFIKASFEGSFRKDDDAIERVDALLTAEARADYQAYVDAHPQVVQPKLWRRADQADEFMRRQGQVDAPRLAADRGIPRHLRQGLCPPPTMRRR